MNVKEAKQLAVRLRRRGFDKTTYSSRYCSVRPRCSQCQALCINGIACHETNCPNMHYKLRR